MAHLQQQDDCEIEIVKQMRLLGLIVTSELKWKSNTEHMVAKAFKKLWIIRRLKSQGAVKHYLVDMYIKQVRSILELAVQAWAWVVTMEEKDDIERVYKGALQVILGDQYKSYPIALSLVGLETLECRRSKLCLKFALKAEKTP